MSFEPSSDMRKKMWKPHPPPPQEQEHLQWWIVISHQESIFFVDYLTTVPTSRLWRRIGFMNLKESGHNGGLIVALPRHLLGEAEENHTISFS
jgi:hypothetical protein